MTPEQARAAIEFLHRAHRTPAEQAAWDDARTALAKLAVPQAEAPVSDAVKAAADAADAPVREGGA